MKRNAGSLFIIIISVMALSCEKELDVKLIPKNPLLVLNCAVVADSTWLVRLTRTASILDYRAMYPLVYNAEITIRDEHDQIIETLENYQPPVVSGRPTGNYTYNYRGKTTPVPGKIYSIVAKSGDELVRAHSRIPSPVALTSVAVDSFHYASDRNIEMKLSFQDPGDEKNYYQVKIYRDIIQIPHSLQNGVWQSDSSKAYISRYVMPYYSVGLVNELDGFSSLFTDDLFDGKNYELELLVQDFNRQKNDYPVHVVLISMNKEYYDYFSSAKLANDAEGNPLLQPVQVYTNIENGLGIFAGYSVSEILLE